MKTKMLIVPVPGFGDDPLEDDLCSLEFHHYTDSRLLTFSTDKVNLFLLRGATSCAVVLADGRVLLGHAWCYRKDKFGKRRGEREALRKALEETQLPREERKWIWQEYLRKRPVLKSSKGQKSAESSSFEDVSRGWFILSSPQSNHRRKEGSPKPMND